jgi:adenine-specific DNA methylase
MLKRLIEVALPLKEVSVSSAREKLTRHGNISTLHIWWARRPLAACRAVVFASLIPDPDDANCPQDFRELVTQTLSPDEFKPRNGDGSTVEDTPRNRCLEFIKRLVERDSRQRESCIQVARTLIAAARKSDHTDGESHVSKVLDPFAGGGAIPLEALRLGCEAHAVDLNPVAHLIELCTLVYPQKYGQPDSRPVPEYIKRLISRNRATRKPKREQRLFDDAEAVAALEGEIIPDVEITEAEYRKNPLAADVKYWGHLILKQARSEIGSCYPSEPDGSLPLAWVWARTIRCGNPTCGAVIPLFRSLWLSKNKTRRTAMRMVADHTTHECRFEIAVGQDIDFDPNIPTIQAGKAQCPFCQSVVDSKALRSASINGHIGEQLMAVVVRRSRTNTQDFRAPERRDETVDREADSKLRDLIASLGPQIIPDEEVPPDRPAPNARGLSGVVRYGFNTFGKLFRKRQLLALVTFSKLIRSVESQMSEITDDSYKQAIVTVLGVSFGRAPDHWSQFCIWNPTAPTTQHSFGRQALPMVWDFSETNPFGGSAGDWSASINSNTLLAIVSASETQGRPAHCHRGTATKLPFDSNSVECVVTDPPYYESVPYGDLSDFFYVWLKRTLSGIHQDVLRTPLTPKAEEAIAYYGGGKRKVQKTPEWYESKMCDAFREIARVVRSDGIASIMFAHKTTSAWERIIAAMNEAGLIATASWPIHTENMTRMVAMGSAALASSVTLVCRKRNEGAGSGLWDDVRQELKTVAQERLDFFWSQGIRGADFFISAIGPALSVFGKYERVSKLSGEDVSVGLFLDEVRSLVTNYALAKILKTTQTGTIDPESRFYVVWKWSYADAKVPADESFKLAQAFGLDTESLWDKSGVLEKSGENVQATAVAKRIKVKNLGEPTADGAPASLIDVLHRMCAFREKGDTEGMVQFLGRSGHANNHSLWLVAQAVSEILPDGDKEKQLMQGLLNQKEGLEEAARQGRLF